MTIEEKITELLQEHGMWGEGPSAVIERMKAEKHLEGVKWSDHIEGYPPQLLGALWFIARRIALEWIDENMPLAFYRSMFTEDPAA